LHSLSILPWSYMPPADREPKSQNSGRSVSGFMEAIDSASVSQNGTIPRRRPFRASRVARFVCTNLPPSPCPVSWQSRCDPPPWDARETAETVPTNAPDCSLPVYEDNKAPPWYDVVPRGRMPGIVFRDNAVSLLYRSHDPENIW
jgi:hypothetical protein